MSNSYINERRDNRTWASLPDKIKPRMMRHVSVSCEGMTIRRVGRVRGALVLPALRSGQGLRPSDVLASAFRPFDCLLDDVDSPAARNEE